MVGGVRVQWRKLVQSEFGPVRLPSRGAGNILNWSNGEVARRFGISLALGIGVALAPIAASSSNGMRSGSPSLGGLAQPEECRDLRWAMVVFQQRAVELSEGSSAAIVAEEYSLSRVYLEEIAFQHDATATALIDVHLTNPALMNLRSRAFQAFRWAALDAGSLANILAQLDSTGPRSEVPTPPSLSNRHLNELSALTFKLNAAGNALQWVENEFNRQCSS